MYCRNCGEKLVEGLSECPFCHQKVMYKHKNIYSNVNSRRNQSGSSFVWKLLSIIMLIVGIKLTLDEVDTMNYLWNNWWALSPEERQKIGDTGVIPSDSSSLKSDTSKVQTSSIPKTTEQTTIPKTAESSTSIPKTTQKNYQQIYDEYSKKLIDAAPTSSVSEMADIMTEGGLKMAQYMYSAKGTEGKYETYQSWYNKLFDVYMNNTITFETSESTPQEASPNYQQIYDEYSQKLIAAGPTSSVSEMSDILSEGTGKMAEYMYSAKGTEGQYETYSTWADKLIDVYIENCR